MKISSPLFALFLLLSACIPPATPDVASAGVVQARADETIRYERYRSEANRKAAEGYVFERDIAVDPFDYLPDTNNVRLLPFRYLRVNYHIMNTTDTLYDYAGQQGRDRVVDVVVQANTLIRRMPTPWLSPDSSTVTALPRQLRFNIARKPGTDAFAIYEHYDDVFYWYLHRGRNRNRATRTVIEKYAIRPDSELNVFIMGPPRDSLNSKSFRITGTDGIYLGNAIKMTGWLERSAPAWEIAPTLVHEFGHALGLAHAWGRDGCEDTPSHTNKGWFLPKNQTGPGKSSNNLMDYSNRMEALTPCQIGRMHARMSDITGRQRKWLQPVWCEYRKGESIKIKRDVTLNGARDYGSDIFLQRGSRLIINNRIHLPEGAAIHVAPGARLEIGPKAVIHNDCGGQWAGVRIGTNEYGESGEVFIDPLAVFLNVVP